MKPETRFPLFGVVLAAALLAGCAKEPPVLPVAAEKNRLPDIPAEIRRCFNGALGEPPDRDLTIEEVERAWKADRVRAVVLDRCGDRFVAWFDALRARWQ